MAADKNIVVLVHLAVLVNVCGKHFNIGKIACSEIVTLYENIVILVNSTVRIYVAQQICGGFGADVGVMACGFLAYNNVFFVNHFAVFDNTQNVFTCGDVVEGIIGVICRCGLFEQRLFFAKGNKHNFNSFVLLYAFDLAVYTRGYAAQTAILAYAAVLAKVYFRVASEANCAVPFIVKLFCKTFSASAAIPAVFIAQAVRAFHTVPAIFVFSAQYVRTYTAINAVILIFYRTFGAVSAFVAVVNTITAFSAFAAFSVNRIATLAVGAVRSAYNPAVSTIIPALRAHFGAVFAKVAIGTMHKCVALEAFTAFSAVEPFLKHSAFDTEIAADSAEFGAIFANTAITADSGAAFFCTFAALGAKPTVVFTANRAVSTAGFTLTVYLKAFIAFYTMVIVVAYTAKLAIGADIFAVVANAAILTINFTEIAEAAFGAGLAVCFVAFHAYFFAIFADLNAIFTEVAFGADKHAILTGIAAITAV